MLEKATNLDKIFSESVTIMTMSVMEVGKNLLKRFVPFKLYSKLGSLLRKKTFSCTSQ